MPLPRIAIATGDPAGIGPEIALKAAINANVRALCRPLLVGDPAAVELHARSAGLSPTLHVVEDPTDADWTEGTVNLLDARDGSNAPIKFGTVDAAYGRASLASAKRAIKAALAGDVEAVVAAPQTERAIAAAHIAFDGYPSFVARVCGLPADDAVLMLCFQHEGREVRIAHVTLHTSVQRALGMITKERIVHTLRAVHAALLKLGIAEPRIAVGGVNPHAGESGAFGREEIDVVDPAITEARRGGLTVDGPIGADTLIQRKGYDAYVVMLHDQGHVAAKLLAPQRVAALTIGTPVLFSSVAHGSALDIAGQGKAKPDAIIEAITRLVGRRRRDPAT